MKKSSDIPRLKTSKMASASTAGVNVSGEASGGRYKKLVRKNAAPNFGKINKQKHQNDPRTIETSNETDASRKWPNNNKEPPFHEKER